MNKFKLFAVTAMTLIISMIIPVTANAASPYCSGTQKNVVSFSSSNPEDAKNKLKEYGIDIESLNSNSGSCNSTKAKTNVSQSSKCTDTEAKKAATSVPSSKCANTTNQTKSAGQTQSSEQKVVTKPAGTCTKETTKTNSGTTQTGNTGTQNTNTQNTNTQNTSTDTKTDKEQLTYAQQVVQLVNEERAKVGLAPLTIDAKVEAAANVRAKETMTSFSHTRPDGTSFSTALKDQSVSYRMCGENIAYGQKSPEEVMKAWMNSSGHKANILNENYTTIGVGYYQSSNGTNYWSQLFTK